MTDKSLSFAERLILSNQLSILKILDPEQARYYDEAQEIVNNGYEYMYGNINQSVYETPLPVHISEEVVEILDMFRALEFSCRKLGVRASDLGTDFEGFDANEADGHYGFARFLRRKLGRWEELKDYPDNSHSSISLHRYRSMIERWHGIGRKFELSEEEVRQVVG
ncbi:YfbU family protein [Rhizobium mayense]|uniref:YfbU family protein n=1 Tax=Rhizobium mayense TaxID=1312184 RepID=UPI00398C3BB8